MRTDNTLKDYKNNSYHEFLKSEKMKKTIKYGIIAGGLSVVAGIALSAQTIIASIPSPGVYDSTQEKIQTRHASEQKAEQKPIQHIAVPTNSQSNLSKLSLEEIMAQEQKITYYDLKKEIIPKIVVKDIEYVTYRGPHIESIKDLAEKRGYHVYEKGKNKDKKIIINTYLKSATSVFVKELRLNYQGLEKTLKKFTRKEDIEVYSPTQIEELEAISCIERDMPSELCISNSHEESRDGNDEISICNYNRMINKIKMKNGKPIIKNNKPVIEKKILYQTKIVSAAGPGMVNVWGNQDRFKNKYNLEVTWDMLLRNTPFAIDLGNDILKEQLNKYKRFDFTLATYNGGDKAIKNGRIVLKESKNHARKVIVTMKEYENTGYAEAVKNRLKTHAIKLAQRPRLAQNK